MSQEGKGLMKAAVYSKFDDLKDFSVISVVEVPVPTPGPGDVLVKVLRAAANPADFKVLNSAYAQRWRQPLPHTMGFDFSGVIVAVGENVREFQVSQEVWGMNFAEDLDRGPGGAFAEYISVNAHYVSLKPKEISFDVAAGLGMVGTTAYQAVSHIKAGAGMKLLILGGSTAIGFFAIQLARLKGADVTTTCSTRSIDFVKQAKPNDVIDYTKITWWETGRVFDAILDTTGEKDGFAHAKLLLPKNGTFISIASFDCGGDPKGHLPLIAFSFAANASGGPVLRDDISRLFKENKLTLPVDSTFPLTTEGVRDLLKKQLEGKSLGKNILHVADN